MGVQCKSIYDPADPADGVRVLTTNYWPRGISRERAGTYKRVLGPSRELLRALDADECMRRALFRIRRPNVYQKSMESARVWHFAREMCAGIAYLQRRQFIGRVQVSRARWRVGAST